MVQYTVDSEHVSQQSTAIRGTIERIRTEVQTMHTGLAELQNDWSGQAAASFQNLVSEWQRTQAMVEVSLEGISEALTAASSHYAEAEAANAQLFAH